MRKINWYGAIGWIYICLFTFVAGADIWRHTVTANTTAMIISGSIFTFVFIALGRYNIFKD